MYWHSYCYVPVFCLITGSVAMAQEKGQSGICAENILPANCHVRRVSIINLIATPERYDGKPIQVFGHLALAFENTGISMGGRDFGFNEVIDVRIGNGNFADNAALERYQKQFKLWNCKFHGKWVRLEGIFHAQPYINGDPLPSPGTIEITDIVPGWGVKEGSCKHLEEPRKR